MRKEESRAGKLNVDFKRIAQDFKGLDPNDPGVWPLAPRLTVLVILLIGVVAAIWWFDWQDQVDLLDQRQSEEIKLREEWKTKKHQAINLEEYRQQLAEIDQQFGALLRQLPNRTEMESLLSEINQAGLGRGLQFDLFKPGGDAVKDFYAEMPITVMILGSYHDLGAFASDISRMPRIVTLNDISLESVKDGMIKLNGTATTYRYLDDEEVAKNRQAAKKGK
ncbi:MAG: type 4a pilus biogenesis protein PilO [Zoogloeaceae bacterium]|nr:type 4a pilus biogenesis protein PilO [Zoogloeaceae bacterium]